MSQDLEYAVSIRVDNGALVNLMGTVHAEAYEKIKITVPAGDTGFQANLGAADRIQLLALVPDAPSAEVTYDAGNGITVALDQYQFLFGAAVKLLPTVGTLALSNAGAVDANITIVVGRDVATPPA